MIQGRDVNKNLALSEIIEILMTSPVKKHKRTTALGSMKQLIKTECDAWNYAFKCTKTKHHQDLLQTALFYIQTYNQASKNEVGFEFSEEELVKMIKKGIK